MKGWDLNPGMENRVYCWERGRLVRPVNRQSTRFRAGLYSRYALSADENVRASDKQNLVVRK